MSTQIWGDKETQFFYELTPDRILNAIEAQLTDMVCTGLILPLNSMENRVYEIELEPRDFQAGSQRSRVIAKFYRPGRWTEAQILDEHNFLQDLAENEIPVIKPLPFSDGSTLQQMPEAKIWFTVFPKYNGRMPDELSEEDLLQVGRLLGRMHNVGSLKHSEHRLTINAQTFGYQNLESIIAGAYLPSDIAQQYEDTAREILSMITPLFDSITPQRIHGDCHFGNLLHGRDGYFWVDFDDMLMGPPVQDIWLLVPGRDDEARRKLACLLEGYEMMRDFDYSTKKFIEPLRTLRFIHFSAWIAKRWDDPSFKKAFPDFATSKYWHTQLRDLQEQKALIQGVL